jgi:hypothetical protein
VGALLSALTAFVPYWHLSTWTSAATTVAATIGTQVAATQQQRIAQAYAAHLNVCQLRERTPGHGLRAHFRAPTGDLVFRSFC